MLPAHLNVGVRDPTVQVGDHQLALPPGGETSWPGGPTVAMATTHRASPAPGRRRAGVPVVLPLAGHVPAHRPEVTGYYLVETWATK